MKPKIDLAATLIDFASEFEASPEISMETFLSLLADPVACHARLIILEALDPDDASALSDGGGVADAAWLDEITRSVIVDGPIRALETGKATIADLDLITWRRHALLKVHKGLMNPFAQDQSPDTAARAETPAATDRETIGHLTWFARHDLFGLRRRLKDVIPLLVEFLGWDELGVDDLLDVLVDRCRYIGERRFRDAINEWLEDYAQTRSFPYERSLTSADWRLVLYRSAIQAVRKRYLLDRKGGWCAPQWVSDYFDQIAHVADVTPRELLQVSPVSDGRQLPYGLPGFRRDVYDQVSFCYAQACHEWELA